MRTIAFRGKSVHTGDWHYGDLIQPTSGACYIQPHRSAGYMSIPETVGQFTGLYDKNGKEVYENDLVIVNGQIYKVVYFKGMFTIEIKGCGYVPLKNVIIEVIGNIYDNKELLED